MLISSPQHWGTDPVSPEIVKWLLAEVCVCGDEFLKIAHHISCCVPLQAHAVCHWALAPCNLHSCRSFLQISCHFVFIFFITLVTGFLHFTYCHIFFYPLSWRSSLCSSKDFASALNFQLQFSFLSLCSLCPTSVSAPCHSLNFIHQRRKKNVFCICVSLNSPYLWPFSCCSLCQWCSLVSVSLQLCLIPLFVMTFFAFADKRFRIHPCRVLSVNCLPRELFLLQIWLGWLPHLAASSLLLSWFLHSFICWQIWCPLSLHLLKWSLPLQLASSPSSPVVPVLLYFTTWCCVISILKEIASLFFICLLFLSAPADGGAGLFSTMRW